MARYFVPPRGVQQPQAQKTVTQAQGNSRQTGDINLGARGFTPAPIANVKAATGSEFMGRSRNVLDSINVPASRSARSAVGGGPPVGIPRFQRSVSASGQGPSGERPRAQDSRAFRPGAPPLMMRADTVKKASGYNPRLMPPTAFGAKAAVQAAKRPKASIYSDSPLGMNSPSFVRSSGGFTPPERPSEAQANVSAPQKAMPVGLALSAVAKPKDIKSVPGKWNSTSSNLRPPNRGVQSVTGAQTFAPARPKLSMPTQTAAATVKLATSAKPLPLKPSPGAPGMKQ